MISLCPVGPLVGAVLRMMARLGDELPFLLRYPDQYAKLVLRKKTAEVEGQEEDTRVKRITREANELALEQMRRSFRRSNQATTEQIESGQMTLEDAKKKAIERIRQLAEELEEFGVTPRIALGWAERL